MIAHRYFGTLDYLFARETHFRAARDAKNAERYVDRCHHGGRWTQKDRIWSEIDRIAKSIRTPKIYATTVGANGS